MADLNPIRYRGYYYDTESGLYYLQGRYYDPSVGQFISPDTMQALQPNVIGGVDLYSYANNNPLYVNKSTDFTKMSVISNSTDIEHNISNKLNFDWFFNSLDISSTIHGYTSISGLVNHTAYFAKNLTPFADDMTMLGVSMKDGVLAFNQFGWGLGKSDVFGIALGVGLDIYDSIQRGVSPGGVVLGATLTAVKGVGLIYLNKGILYGATALGSAICPGVGTVVGFVVGGVVCIVVDIFVSNLLDDLIDKIAK